MTFQAFLEKNIYGGDMKCINSAIKGDLIMSIFDEIGKLIVETGQNAAQRTRGISDAMKLNSMISEEERSIKNAFYQIGKKYCELFGGNPDQNLVQLVNEVRDSMEKIQTYSDQIKQIKGIVSCSSCGSEVSNESSFCEFCGASMYSFQTPSGSGSIHCGDCGASTESDAAFCIGCGCKLG